MADSSQNQNFEHNSIHHSTVNLEQTTNNYIQQSPPMEKRWPRRQRLLLEEIQSYIKRRLAYVDNQEVMIPLTVTEQPGAVSGPELKLKLKTAKGEMNVTSRRMIDIFQLPEVGRKLLILGNPGSGKTTTLLQLADELVAQALEAPESEIPIIFELSDWKDDKQSIWDWIKAQLKEKINVQPEESEAWLGEQRILPLLDGLDELDPDRQVKCISAINEFLHPLYRGVVVCCRAEEYRIAQKELGIELNSLRGAVFLEPLSDEQVKSYLNQLGRAKLWDAIHINSEMIAMLNPKKEGESGLLRIPLLLNMAAVVYEGVAFSTKEALLQAYVQNQLSHKERRQKNTPKKKRWKIWVNGKSKRINGFRETHFFLHWLAVQRRHYNTEFMPEKIQPFWLGKNTEQLHYMVTFGVISGLTRTMLFTPWLILISQVFSPSFLLVFSSTFAASAMFDLISKDIGRIRFCERFAFNKEGLACGFHSAINGCKFFFAETALEYSKIKGAPNKLVFILWTVILASVAFIWTFTYGSVEIVIASYSSKLKYVTFPYQVFKQSLTSFVSSLFFFSFAIAALVSLAILFHMLISDLPEIGFGGSLAVLISVFLLLFFFNLFFILPLFAYESFGGRACIKHLCLRYVLARNGYIPYRYVRFLNYCVERRLLQRIGGRYRFIHRELQDHFAAQYRP